MCAVGRMMRARLRCPSLPGYFAVLLVLGALSYSGFALAQTRRTAIALVTRGVDKELHARLRAELRALGWRVVEVLPGKELALAQVARRAGTLAVLRVGQAAEGIEIWVASEADAEAKSEWVDVDTKRPELAVVLAVEALRARFLEFGLEPEHWSSEKKSPVHRADAPLLARTPPDGALPDRVVPGPDGPSLWLEAGAAGMTAPSRISASAEVAIRYLPNRWLGFELAGWWPLNTTLVRGTGGSAIVRTALALGSGELRWDLGEGSLGAGVGLGVAKVDMKGQPTAGYVGRSDSVLSLVPFGRVAYELPLAVGFRLRVTTNVGASAPRAVVRFDEKVIASWGRPFVALTLGAQGRLFGDVP